MLRLQNSKWQDWNYASLMDFSTFAVETFDVTMQWADILIIAYVLEKQWIDGNL